jgi:hypothetical protein
VAFPTSLKARFSNQNITFCWLVSFWEYAGPCQGGNLQVKGRVSQGLAAYIISCNIFADDFHIILEFLETKETLFLSMLKQKTKLIN